MVEESWALSVAPVHPVLSRCGATLWLLLLHLSDQPDFTFTTGAAQPFNGSKNQIDSDKVESCVKPVSLCRLKPDKRFTNQAVSGIKQPFFSNVVDIHLLQY